MPTIGLASSRSSGHGNATCSSKFVLPEAPSSVVQHNGVALQDVCITGDGPFHAFILGDWGAIKDPKNNRIAAASHLSHRWGQAYKFVWPVDEQAQELIAKQMKKRAPVSKPDYVLNVGDNFYWAGVEDYCGAEDITSMYSGGGTTLHKHKPVDQFKDLFEDMYNGPGLDGKPWLGVLGNHDYGGWRMDHAWDQAIGYSWSKQSTGRWMTPALYWRVKVRYPDFSVDYYFMDTNVWDGLDPKENSPHNICGKLHNPPDVSCPGGPKSLWDCEQWFATLWSDQKKWLDRVVPESTADWRIVVTHFPPYWGKKEWKQMSEKHEIDLIVTGHRHSQFARNLGDEPKLIWPEWGHKAALREGYSDFLDPTAWLVSGGGGGVTSEHVPSAEGEDDQYGFMDLTLAKDKLVVEMISHMGQLRRTLTVKPHYPHNPHWTEWKTTVTTTTTEAPEAPEAPKSSGGHKWAPVHSGEGACRTADAGQGEEGTTFTLHLHVASLDDCKALCAKADKCTGIEHSSHYAGGRCEVWKEPIGGASSSEGFTCLRFRQGKDEATTEASV